MLAEIPEHEQDDEMQVQIIAAAEMVERWRNGDLPIVYPPLPNKKKGAVSHAHRAVTPKRA